MIYCFDLDGTICTNTEGNYDSAKPYIPIIKRINNLYRKGNSILIYSARGSTTGIDWIEKTKKQLDRWGVKYHSLFFGKPNADLFIDDKGIKVSDWMKSKV